MVPPPTIPLKVPPKKASNNTEKDATPSDIYKSILVAKIARVTPSTIPGIGRSTADTSCGSFYNPGDNRIRRAVYKENVAKLSVTSISFNPVTWECASCPNRHPVLGKDEAGGDGRPVIFLTDQNFLAVLPTATGKCLAIIRLEHGTLKELTDLILNRKGKCSSGNYFFVLGSLTHLQCEGLQGYSSAGVRYGTKISGTFSGTTVVLFIPPPMGGCANPQLVRSIMDGCSWLCNIPSYPLKKCMQTVMNIVNEGAGSGTAPLSNRDDQVIYLPANTDDYSGAYLTSPGRRNIPATTPPWTGMSEKKFLDDLIGNLSRNLLAGRDVEPNLSCSVVRPAMYTAIRTGSVESAIFVGGSNAKELAHQASALGLDAYQITKGGWKIMKDNVDKLIPDLRDVLGSVPPNTPVVIFC
jgi:hypothetical protein